jgi:hypothetical protein
MTTESECPDEKEAAEAAKKASAAANKALFKYRLVRPGSFKTENHFYPRVINSQIHPTVRFFMGLSQERIVERYCHMHPKVDRDVLMDIIKYRSEHFHWAGCDLMHTVNNAGEKKMVSGGGGVVIMDYNQSSSSTSLISLPNPVAAASLRPGPHRD